MSKSNLYKLQKVQNAAARLIVRKNKRHSVTNIMKELHWLKIESRIIFKILLLVYKCVLGKCSNNLKIKYKSHNCRPNDYLWLETKRVNTKYGRLTFNYSTMQDQSYGMRFHFMWEWKKISIGLRDKRRQFFSMTLITLNVELLNMIDLLLLSAHLSRSAISTEKRRYIKIVYYYYYYSML